MSDASTSLAQLHRALERFDAADDATRPAVEADIWAAFGTEGAALVLDMSGFSQTVKRRGIVPYLSMVRRMQHLTRPRIEAHRGVVVKYEADNLYALFPEPESALSAAREIIAACAAEPVARPEDRVSVSIGIAAGPLLHIPGADFFGDCVNTAAKLGEDLAPASEILMAKDTAMRLSAASRATATQAGFEVSGVRYEVLIWSPRASREPGA